MPTGRGAAIDTPATVELGRLSVGRGHPTYVIAELGVNHEGDAPTCARMIEAARTAGADAVKLQTLDPDENYARGTVSYEIFSAAQLTREETTDLFAHARGVGLDVFTTAGDLRTLEFVETLAPVAHKISSGLLTHHPLIEAAARTRRPLILSTGMADMEEVAASVSVARAAGSTRIVLLQCTSLYPAPAATLNLRAIGTLEHRFGVPVGFSDHSIGPDAPAFAVAAGATVIEKHFSLDPSRQGFDHGVSLSPEGFAEMVQMVRSAEEMLGDGLKAPTADEVDLARRYRRQLVARTDLLRGTALDLDRVGFLRLGEDDRGIPASDWPTVEGRTLARSVRQWEPIDHRDLV